MDVSFSGGPSAATHLVLKGERDSGLTLDTQAVMKPTAPREECFFFFSMLLVLNGEAEAWVNFFA